jgi:hypothetical protein
MEDGFVMADIGIATLALTQGFAQFQAHLPKLSEIRKADPANDPEFTADVRMGEVAAFIGTMGIGVIVSSLTGDPLPTYISLIVCALLIGLYESVLRSYRPLERTA